MKPDPEYSIRHAYSLVTPVFWHPVGGQAAARALDGTPPVRRLRLLEHLQGSSSSRNQKKKGEGQGRTAWNVSVIFRGGAI